MLSDRMAAAQPYVTLQGPELPSGHVVFFVVLPKTVGP
jgi:hypothetical protein